MVGTGKGTAADVADAKRGQAEGHVAFKIKVGVADPREDAERTRAICEALDGNGNLLICADANQGWTPDQAITYVRAVEDTALAFFEQPVAGHDLEGMAKVARASRVPDRLRRGAALARRPEAPPRSGRRAAASA